jgi:LmbE family N-acetylglucosaminyl deacetylase
MVRSSHPDHLDTGEAVMRAVYPDAGNRHAWSELLADGLEPWTVPEVWFVNSPSPNRYLDITKSFARKVEAVCCHRSQVGDGRDIERFLRRRLEANRLPAGLSEGQLAEAFQVVVTG